MRLVGGLMSPMDRGASSSLPKINARAMRCVVGHLPRFPAMRNRSTRCSKWAAALWSTVHQAWCGDCRRSSGIVGLNKGWGRTASLGPAPAHQCEEVLAIPSRLPENAGLASGDGLLVPPGRNASSPGVSGIDAGTKVSVVAVAQLVRVPDCDSGGRGFESPQPPH